MTHSEEHNALTIVDSHKDAEQLTDNMRTFIEAYCQNGFNVTQAAVTAGISRQAHYLNAARSSAYKNVFEHAVTQTIRTKIAEWVQQAHEGERRYKFKSDGTPILHPETGEPYFEMVYPWIPRIFYSKALADMNDQPTPRQSDGKGPTIHIHIPEQIVQQQPFVIEHNQAQDSQCSEQETQSNE